MNVKSVHLNFRLLSGVLVATGMLFMLALLASFDTRPAGAYSISSAFPSADWNEATPLPYPSAAHAFAQCPDDPNTFYIIKGYTLRYHADTGIWEINLAPPPHSWWLGAAACYQGKIYLAGGDNSGGVDRFSIYDIATDTWTEGPAMPRAEVGAAVAAWDGKIYVIGGVEYYGDPPTSQVNAFDIATNTWTADALPPMPVAAYFAGFAQAGQYIYLVGGFADNFSQNVNATQRLDLAGGAWDIGPEFTSARAGPATAVNNNHLYTIGGDADGGTDKDTSDLVEVLDLSLWPGGAWQDLGAPLPQVSQANFNYACTEAITGGEIWSIGGIDATVYPWVEYDTNLYHSTGGPCTNFFFGDVSPENLASSGLPGEVVTYSLTIVNDGTETDTYDISASAVWLTSYPPNVGPVAPGESAELIVTVEIPADADPNDFDIAMITVTSQGDPAASDEATLTTGWTTEWIKDETATLPEPMVGGTVQCPNQPNIIYLVGGMVGNHTSERLYRYDAASSGPWERLADMPLPLRGHGTACYDNKIYVAGGLVNAMNRLFIYNIADDTWTQGALLPNPTGGANLGAWDGKLYLIGGSRQGGLPYTPIPRVDVYDIAANTWTAGAGTDMPTATAYAGGVQRGQYYYIAGGISGDPNHNVSRTQVYDMANDTWQTIPDLPSQRGINGMATSSTLLYMLGGDENGHGFFDPTSLVETLDLTTCPDCQWADLGDPLHHATVFTPGACTEAKTGGEIWAISGMDEGLYPYTEVYYRPTGVPCVQQIVNLPDYPMQGDGEIGKTAYYTLAITNTGNITDYYNLIVSSEWPGSLVLGGPGPVGPGETIEVVIGVDVPADANIGDVGQSNIRIESLRDPSIMDSIQIFTTVIPTYEVYLVPETMEQSGMCAKIITYTLTVSNGGNITDTFTLTYTGSTWEVSLPVESFELAPAESAQVVLTVIIPADAWVGQSDTLVLTATSAGNPAVSDSATLTTTAFWYRTLISLTMRN